MNHDRSEAELAALIKMVKILPSRKKILECTKKR